MMTTGIHLLYYSQDDDWYTYCTTVKMTTGIYIYCTSVMMTTGILYTHCTTVMMTTGIYIYILIALQSWWRLVYIFTYCYSHDDDWYILIALQSRWRLISYLLHYDWLSMFSTAKRWITYHVSVCAIKDDDWYSAQSRGLVHAVLNCLKMFNEERWGQFLAWLARTRKNSSN